MRVVATAIRRCRHCASQISRLRVSGSGPVERLRSMERRPGDFSSFYAAYRDPCLRAVLASTGDRHAAEDMVAEAFARAWAAWGKVSRYESPQAWVVRTALNAGVSSWRKRRREVSVGSCQIPDVVPVDDINAGRVSAAT